VLFLALAWYVWHGWWAIFIVALVTLEILITLVDFAVEDKSRALPRNERWLHTLLAIGVGAILLALWPVVHAWFSLPTAIVPADHGTVSGLFTVFAAGAAAWSLRNALASLRHYAPSEWVRNPIAIGTPWSGRTVLVSGATGFLGGHVVRRLLGRGDRVWVWTRDADRALARFGPHVRIVTDLDTIPGDTRLSAIVHLAGARVFGIPWTRARRAKLLASRLETAQALLSLAGRLETLPGCWISASAIGFYGAQGDAWLSESSPPSEEFQSQLCEAVETMADAVRMTGIRTVSLRIGLVLGADGGVLPALARAARFGAAAVLGEGRQWISWIHVEDLARVIELAIDRPRVSGVVNAVAPNPVRQSEFQRLLTRALRRPLWFKVPAVILRKLLGEMAGLLVDGQRVFPARLAAERFTFRYPSLRSALRSLLARSRRPTLRASDAPACEVYFNADCPVCNAEMTRYRDLLTHADAHSFAPMRFIDGPRELGTLAEHGLRREHAEGRLYLRDERGNLSSGFDAVLLLWDRLPYFRRISPLFRLPLLRPLCTALYDHAVAPSLARWARSRSKGPHTARAGGTRLTD
jgi:uncharacterized protein